MMSSIKTTSNYLKSKFGEISLKNLFEHQAEEFASNTKRSRFRADYLARDTILYNFQPLGIEATYSGNADEAKIFVKNCPLPQRFLGQPEFLEQITFDQKQLFTDFGGDTLTAKGEWPPKRDESCNVCRIVMPEIGKKLGFEWEWGLTTDTYRKCFFTIKVKQD